MRVGIFDSGLGGLSTWLACTRYLPNAEYFFFADTANAPYGDRTAEEVRAFTQAACQHFLQLDVDALVIACNTATSAAVAPLREQAPMPVIGIEPAIKLALQESAGEVLLLATELTVHGAKLEHLLRGCDVEQRVRALACSGWMEIIERQANDWRAHAQDYWYERIAPQLGSAQALVLGCTHYCWLREEISAWSGGKTIFDGNDGVARQLYRLLLRREPLTPPDRKLGPLVLHFAASAAAASKMAAAERLLRGMGVQARILPF
ncbi:glutamate racemase [Acidithiobacillus sp. IBUN Pt1247-S3]|uniref:glutamate racemase n=1 Tax=Acidithiobacillus sp. IBUN Pt1247-S3 TaxID=3166642 RepID=UPI0034E50108